MESIGTPKTHFQALIHAAVCFVHWENGNRKGVLSLQRTFKQKAESIPAERYMGLNLKRLVADMDALAAPYREAPDKALTPFAEVATPKLEVEGFEPLAVGERELLVLGRHVEEDEDS